MFRVDTRKWSIHFIFRNNHIRRREKCKANWLKHDNYFIVVKRINKSLWPYMQNAHDYTSQTKQLIELGNVTTKWFQSFSWLQSTSMKTNSNATTALITPCDHLPNCANEQPLQSNICMKCANRLTTESVNITLCTNRFCMQLRTKRDYFPVHSYLTCFYGDGVYLPHTTNWVF